MSAHRGSLPTLTEVIEIDSAAQVQAVNRAALQAESMPLESSSAVCDDMAAALTAQVLESLRPRIDALLQTRLQAALAPQLARLADELGEQLRSELASALQALAAQAVDEALARRRNP
jgi:hypothetical protein